MVGITEANLAVFTSKLFRQVYWSAPIGNSTHSIVAN
jgi:hypothetical protein